MDVAFATPSPTALVSPPFRAPFSSAVGALTVADAASVVEAEEMNGKVVAGRVDVPAAAVFERVGAFSFPAGREVAGAVTVS